MKLLAKARPVQINKLRLGGKDIKSKDDLMKNFYINEIISLDSKFTQWLDRDKDLMELSRKIKVQFGAAKSKEEKAIILISLFFPEYNGENIKAVLMEWLSGLSNGQRSEGLVASLLSCCNQDESLVLSLLRRSDFVNVPFVWSWLQEYINAVNILSPDLCYEYALALKERRDSTYKGWIKKAAELGQAKAIEDLKKISGNIVIELSPERKLTMLRVPDSNGTFFISKEIITYKDFYSVLRNMREYISQNGYQKRNICDDFLKALSRKAGYKLNYPKVSQLLIAKSKMEIDETPSKDGEWCLEAYGNNRHRVVDYCDKTLFDTDYSYLRPVIDVNENPELQ